MAANRSDIRVMVVEDDPGTRNALAALLSGSPGFTCAGAYRSARLALERLAVDQPRVILVDLEMPGMEGVEFLGHVRERHPEIECLVLTVHSEPDFVFPALAAGATGYLVKGVAPAKLLEAIEEVATGGASMSAQIARMVMRTFRKTPAREDDLAALSEREAEVLHLLGQGLSYEEIAAQLHLSKGTINSHLQRIYRKLQVHSATGAVARLHGSTWRRDGS
jgi:DNA-binding NarL/FixJ family response regulator